VLLLRRFDRRGQVRIPFLSAMSLLNAANNEPHSYMEIADALRQYGAKAEEDRAQLWREDRLRGPLAHCGIAPTVSFWARLCATGGRQDDCARARVTL